MARRVRYHGGMRCCFIFLLCCGAALGIASDVGLAAHKISQPPTIDGKVTDEEWNDVPSAEGFVDEATGKPAEPGTFWLGYDSKYIYFAARVRTDPKTVRATEYRTNVSLDSDDTVYIGVDPFGSGSEFNKFGVNAKGATTIDIAGGRAAKREWLGKFTAMGRLTETGYEVEARIPWGIMRLPSPGVRDLRINVARYNPNIQRASLWVYTPNGNQDFPHWRGVDLPRSGNARSIKLLPYAFGGASKDEFIANAGLDLKTSLTDKIDAVATINPDFRNIENQILSLDFSYFERLANESRPFFLEGGDYFQTSRDAPLFASQRINKFDAGFKTFGQLSDKTNIAMLDTIDFGVRNNFVANLTHRLNPNSTVSGAVTSVSDGDRSDNVATFLQANTSKNGLGIFGQHMTTRDTDEGTGHRYNTGFFYEKDGLVGSLEYVEISPRFFPKLGFAPERDMRGITSFFEYEHPVAKGPLMEWGFNIGGRDLKAFDGSQYRRGADLGTSITLRNGLDIDTAFSFEKFRGSNDQLSFFSVEMPRGDSYRHWEASYVTGHIAGQHYQQYGLQVAYRPVQVMQISLQLEEVHYFEKSTQIILGANYDIGKDSSVSGRLVRQGNDINGYLAFRKSGNRGAEYYVILGDPNSQRFQAALVIKAIFPLEIKF